MTDTHLAVLMRRTRPLPDSLARRASAWTRVAEEVAEALAPLLGDEVQTGKPTLSLGAKPGPADVTVPLKHADGVHALLRVDGRVASTLGHLMLRAEQRAGDEPVRLDALLMRSVATVLCDRVSEALGVDLSVSGPSMLGWPRDLPDGWAPFTVRLELSVRGARCAIELLIGEPFGGFATEEEATSGPERTLADAASLLRVPLSAVLDRWTVSGAEAACLRPGTVLPLPGASVERLALTLEMAEGPLALAGGELGKAKGRQAVRLASPVSWV